MNMSISKGVLTFVVVVTLLSDGAEPETATAAGSVGAASQAASAPSRRTKPRVGRMVPPRSGAASGTAAGEKNGARRRKVAPTTATGRTDLLSAYETVNRRAQATPPGAAPGA